MSKFVFKVLAYLFGLMSIGGARESYRIMTSDAPDIASQRGYLTIMSLVILALFLFLTRFFWRKSK